MTSDMLREFLGWCAVINLGLFTWWFLFFALAHDWMYRYHGRWFTLSVERFDAIHYAGMTVYKMFILMFNVIPWIALHIIR